MSYVYLQSEKELWTVGYYDPRGAWQSESDHSSAEEATRRVAKLNGAVAPAPAWQEHAAQLRADSAAECLAALRRALVFAKVAQCPQTLARIRSAIKSAEGAARHADLRTLRADRSA